MTAALLAIVVAVVASLFAAEAAGLAQHLSRRLVDGAIAGLHEDIPIEDRDRWASEILADLASYSKRPFGALLFALHVRRRGAEQLVGVLVPEEARLATSKDEEETDVVDEPAAQTLATLAPSPASPPHDPRWLEQIQRVDALVQWAHETLPHEKAARIEQVGRRLRISLTTLRIQNSTGMPGNIDRATAEFSVKADALVARYRGAIEAGRLPPGD